MNYEALKKQVIKIVKKAAELTSSKNIKVQQKDSSVNIVTSADLAVQEYLCKQLKKILPDSGFFCEEADLRESGKEYIWVIDPIDGTTNFYRNIPDYVISVALMHNNEVVLGVVYCPSKNQLFHAACHQGAFLNDIKIKVSDKTFDEGILCSAMSLYKKEYAKICDEIIYEAYMQCNDIRRFGSCALELCYLAAGKIDLYFEIRVFPWDYAAGYLILKEAGGVLKGYHNETLECDKTTVLIGANNEENFKQLNDIVDKHLKEIPYERRC